MGMSEFRFPMRDADIWGLTPDGEDPDPDDVGANLEFNQLALEDYLSNQLPTVFVQQADIGSGTIDPNQLATGTPGAGKAPVGNPPAWTDVATQSELDTHEADTTSVHGISNTTLIPLLGTDIQRGAVAWTLGITDTNTLTTVIFGTVYSTTPIVTLGLKNDAQLNLAAELTAATSAQFIVRVFPTAGLALGAASGVVHWHAVKQ
jgi:hypothetical protein